MQLVGAKPFKEHGELVDILIEREMEIADRDRAERKLSQVGYYRLSGIWYPFREIEFNGNEEPVMAYGKPKRLSKFLPHTTFDDVFALYIFDKRLRILFLDAIERIEINVRNVMAHTLGKHDPMAYLNDSFINPKNCQDLYPSKNKWEKLQDRHQEELGRCQEECINWHRKTNREIPIWAAVEAWSLGSISKYYGLLKGGYQNEIAKAVGASNANAFGHWLQVLNRLRNGCAHHARIWNQTINNPIKLPSDQGKDDTTYFSSFELSVNSRKNLYGQIVLTWFLVQKIGPNSDWIQHVIDEIEEINKLSLPFDPIHAMGIPEGGLELDKFI
ncbi:TPA: Abi family protein [Vibrio parahaemolyticus]|uniref:Abi family protein n=1 Tax=Vibrio TaxID=662 RepID=UPI0004A33CFE|nr:MULTISPECIES: Abi family protein [Vibrio]EGQ8068571.1 Abi family protein [Vibrio parahaemolyticus]EGQ9887707.1 Abi family protein [Vibrio parahaemolyticus]EGR2264417.1 Abi family protein [Vibrio parahaemolyticus]EIU7056288.1 Abi family protein [Vibrio parahaemolyticus]EJG0889010.1 Abi family protein [Vibrio parahaemolyticus]